MTQPDPSLLARLQACYTGILHDVMRAAGLRHFTLPSSLRPLIPGLKICGPAFTVNGRVDTQADAHETLLAWTGFLSQALPGHIAVIQPNDSVVAHMGELSAETLKRKGVRGVIADGGVRDAEFIQAQGFQVWHRYFTPRDVVGYWLPETMQVDARIGEVTIHPGDLLLADTDGVICLPPGQADALITEAEAMMSRENLVRSAILAGMDPQQAYLKYLKF
jgi:regulator of RNase E activity RraA